MDNWYFLGAAIAAMAIVLGWALFVAGRKLKENDAAPP
jgi:Ca2+/Na+ antiporter